MASNELAPRLPPTGTNASRIAALLRSEPRRPFAVHEIADRLKLSKSTVSKELWRMTRKPDDDRPTVVVRVEHGWYKAFIDASILRFIETPEPCFHALQLSCKLPQTHPWGPPQGAAPTWGDLGAKSLWVRDASNGQFFRDARWAGRPVTIAYTPSTGTVQVSLRASKEPVEVGRFDEFATWTETFLDAAGVPWLDRAAEVQVDNLELNLDYRQLYVSGLEVGRGRVSLRKFRNALVQLYQKSKALRLEARAHGLQDDRMRLPEIASIMNTLATRPREDEAPYAPPSDDYGPEVA